MRHSQPPTPSSPESGNALFLILIAVALFAALSYAVTQSGRGGGSIDREQAVLLAAQITQQGSAMRTTVTRMVLTGTPSDLVASTPSTFFAYDNHPEQADWDTEYGAYGTDPTNELFNPAGGGMILPVPPRAACGSGGCETGAFSGWAFFSVIPVAGIGTTEIDTFALLGGLKLDVCNAINKGLGLSTPPGVEADVSDGIDAYPGAPAACVTNSDGDVFAYYHVLLER